MTATLDAPLPTAGAVSAHRSRIGSRVGATALLVGATGNTAQAVLGQFVGEQPESVDAQIALANQHPVLLTTMCLVGLVSVPFMAVGFVAAAQELGRRARRTAVAAGSLLVLGMWGFLGIQFAMLLQVRALLSDDGRAAAEFLGAMDDSVLGIVVGIPFMAGCVLGMLTLTIAMLVRGGVPRWIPGAWLVFILLDFSIGRIGFVDPHWLYLAGAVGLAVQLLRGGARAGA